MKNVQLLFLLLFLSGSLHAQNQLIWSNDFDLENNGFTGKDPKIELENDVIRILDKIRRDDHTMLLFVEYNLDGDLIDDKVIGREINDTTQYNIIDYVEDEFGLFYMVKQVYVSYNKYRLVLSSHNVDDDQIWQQEIFSVADTSFQPIQISILKDSLLLINYVKSHGYPLDEDQEEFDLVQQTFYSCFDLNGNNLWNIDLEDGGDNYRMVTVEDRWILIGASSKPQVIQLEMDGSYSTLYNFDTFIGPQNMLVTIDNSIAFSNTLFYTFNILNLKSGEIKSYEYPTFLPSNQYGDRIEDITQNVEGDIYTTGRHYGSGSGTDTFTNCDVLTLKFDSEGNLEWENRYEYGKDNCEIGTVIKVKDDFVYVGGRSANAETPSPYDYFVLKLDAETGETMGLYRYDRGDGSDDYLTDLVVLDDGSIVLTGATDPAYWTTQYLTDIVLNVNTSDRGAEVSFYPNPIPRGTSLSFSGNKDFNTFSIYSLQGELCKKGEVSKGQQIDMSGIAAGIYVIKSYGKGMCSVQKIVVE